MCASLLSGRCAEPRVQRYRRAKQRNFRAVNAGANAQCAHRCFQDDALSPAFNVTAVQSKEISELLTLAQTLNVRIAAVTPDACALQRLLPFIPSGRQCLAWRDESQWLWATRYAWGRKSAREATTLHDLAATLSVVPEHISLCAEGEFDPWRVVTVRQPPVPPDGYRFAIALGLAMGEIR